MAGGNEIICIDDSDDDSVPSKQETASLRRPKFKDTTVKSQNARGTQLIGLHRNPSGQSTLAFNKKVKPSHGSKSEKNTFKPPDDQQKENQTVISIKNSRNEDKTEIKIVLPGSSPSQPVKMPKTARKTMSSFTPRFRDQPPEVICIEDTPGKSEASAKSEPHAKRKASEDGDKGECKRRKEDNPKSECTDLRPNGHSPQETNGHDMKPGHVVSALDVIKQFEGTCKSVLQPSHFEKVEKKIEKHLSHIDSKYMCNDRLKAFVSEKMEQLKCDQSSSFTFIRQVLDEMRKYRKSEKKENTSENESTSLPARSNSSVEEVFTDISVKTAEKPTKLKEVETVGRSFQAEKVKLKSDEVASTSKTNQTGISENNTKESKDSEVKEDTAENEEAQLTNEIKDKDRTAVVNSPKRAMLQLVEKEPEKKEHKKEKEPKKKDLKKEKESKEKEKKDPSKRHIKKLERALKACAKEIKRLEEAEVDLDALNDDESPYILVSRYKRRYLMLYRKIAQLKKESARLDRREDKKFRAECSRFPEVNTAIERMINNKKREERFPDYKDVYNVYVEENERHNLCLNKRELEMEAQESFVAVGKKLKSRRQHDLLDVLNSYVPETGEEPPKEESNEELQAKLEENKKVAEEKMETVIAEFVRKQAEANEEPEEVPDDEPVENDEDDDRGEEDLDLEETNESSKPSDSVPNSEASTSLMNISLPPLEGTSQPSHHVPGEISIQSSSEAETDEIMASTLVPNAVSDQVPNGTEVLSDFSGEEGKEIEMTGIDGDEIMIEGTAGEEIEIEGDVIEYDEMANDEIEIEGMAVTALETDDENTVTLD